MRIACTLRSGGRYSPEHVQRLYGLIQQFYPQGDFICLTDMDVPGVPTEPLIQLWPGWWSIVEVLKLPGPVLYMDLAVVIQRDLTPLVEAGLQHEFVALRDFNPHIRYMADGLMFWTGDMSYLYRKMAEDPERHMRECQTSRWWGSQGFIEYYVKDYKCWQDLLPGHIASYKKSSAKAKANSTIMFFHGQPKPWDVGYA